MRGLRKAWLRYTPPAAGSQIHLKARQQKIRSHDVSSPPLWKCRLPGASKFLLPIEFCQRQSSTVQMVASTKLVSVPSVILPRRNAAFGDLDAPMPRNKDRREISAYLALYQLQREVCFTWKFSYC